MATQPRDNDVRLRRVLDGTFEYPRWPAGFSLRHFSSADASALHGLLELAFDDDMNGPFEAWWARLSADDEFDPALCFLVHDGQGRLVGAALCWTSAFIKDLAVHPAARRNGIAEALMQHVFATFFARGAAHVDLKTDLVANADAVKLYRRLGMVEVDWSG